jgi:O-succinylbenzoic acid--CoA ligase
LSSFAIYSYKGGLPCILQPDDKASNLLENEKSVLLFCRQWLSGQEEFTIHTSGSTGTPKPIVLHRKQMTASARMTGQALGLASGDKALVCLNTAYIAGIMMLVRCMELQMEAHIVSPSSNPLEELPTDLSIDFAAFVPLQVQTMLGKASSTLPALNKMKAIIVGGAPVSFALEQEIRQIEASVYSTYGMTETVSHIALRQLNNSQRTDLYKAFDEVELGTDSRGCLTIRSVLTGGDKLATNDLVELIGEHQFRWLGRADQVINSGGVKIHPAITEQKLEKVFYDLNVSARFFITAIPDDKLGETVILFIEGYQDQINAEEFKQTMIRHLSRFEIPKKILFTDQFLETATSKVDRLKTKDSHLKSSF